MNPVAAALDDGVKQQVLEAAAHEVGHGIVWHAAGFRVSRMAVGRGWFGGISNAYCQLSGVWLDAGNAQGYLVGLLGGAAGQASFLTRHCHRGSGGARSTARGNSGYDIGEFRRLARAHHIDLSVTAATRRADAVIARHRGRLDALTVRLARTGHLSGGAL